MFSGIVESKGSIVQSRSNSAGRRLRVRVGSMARECATGASVAVNGVCLTVADSDSEHLEFDVVRETLDRSALVQLRTGALVNTERAVRAGDRIDGHFVQGHVDGTAKVVRVLRADGACTVWFRPEPALKPYLIPKGSVAIDGVSLTIAKLVRDEFSVALIPTTLERTTLGQLKSGDRVNIESDMVVRTVVHYLRSEQGQALTDQHLQRAGFR